MKYHFLYRENEQDTYSKGVNIYAVTAIEAILQFDQKFPKVILLAIFTKNI